MSSSRITRTALRAAVLSVIFGLPLTVAACSGADSGAGPGPGSGDGGATTSDAGTDTNVPPRAPTDAGADANDAAPRPSDDGGDAAVPPGDAGDAGEAGPPPNGTLLVAGTTIQIEAVTSDGFLVYSELLPDGVTRRYSAVPVAGGAATQIFDLGGGALVHEDGAAVFFEVEQPFAQCSSSLAMWTHASGLRSVATDVRTGVHPRVTPDGAGVVFVAIDAKCEMQTVAVASADGAGAQTELLPRSICVPWFEVAANGQIVTASCSDVEGGVAAHDTLSVFRASTRAKVFSMPWSRDALPPLDPSGAWLWAQAATGGQLVSTTDGKVALNDPAATGAAFEPTGSALDYVSGGALKRTLLAAPATSTTLVASGVAGIERPSPDGSMITFGVKSDAGSYELEGVSTSAPGAPWTLAPAPIGLGTLFTADSRFLLLRETSSLPDVTHVSAVPSHGGARITLGDWDALIPLQGSKVLVSDALGWNLWAADPGSSAAPAVLATVVTGHALSADKRQLFYVTPASPPGLYAVQVK